ncbi:MAG: zinc-binding dehydrogenase [Planctomycetota bacterium]
MKAARVTRFGGPEVLEVEERPRPEPGPGEVVLEVHAAGVGFADLLQREGAYPGGPRPPFVPGSEAAGVVVARGEGVDLPLGARVIALTAGGLYATHARVPAARCAPWPASLDAPHAAALGVSGLTALGALVRVARAQEGETVWIPAAGGALGGVALQVAACLGLRAVAFASTAEKRALAAESYAYADAREAPPPDVVLDGVGGDFQRVALRRLRPFGRLIAVGASAGPPPAVDPLGLLHASAGLQGFHLRALLAEPAEVAGLWRTLTGWVDAGRLTPTVSGVFPLCDAGAAQTSLLDRARVGKPVLEVGP